ncbi:hypothetical protein C6A88_04730 [Mycolicibacterium austroafricanum]|nr:hypothetical protein C6A88_04730 [Mycolicibacterium austroafricanum]
MLVHVNTPHRDVLDASWTLVRFRLVQIAGGSEDFDLIACDPLRFELGGQSGAGIWACYSDPKSGHGVRGRKFQSMSGLEIPIDA